MKVRGKSDSRLSWRIKLHSLLVITFFLSLVVEVGTYAKSSNGVNHESHPHLFYPADGTSSIKSKALRRYRALYAQANAQFDNNFNFTSPSMIKMLIEIKDIAITYNDPDTLLSDVYSKMAICYQDLGKDDAAVTALHEAKALRKNKSADRGLFNIYLTLGSLFLKSYAYDSAEYYFGFIEDRLPQFKGLRKNEYHRLWNELGALHYTYGDYKLALNYYDQALQNGLSVFPAKAEQIVTVKNNIIAVLLKLDRIPEAIRKYRSLIAYNNTLPILYHNLGKAYQRVEKYDSALYYLKQSEIRAASDDVLKVKLFNNLATTYIALKKYDDAQQYLDLSIALNRKIYKAKNAALAYSFMNRAKISEQQHRLEEALDNYQVAINSLHFNFKDSSIYNDPHDLDNVVSRPYFFECLRNKASLFRKLYRDSFQYRHLHAAFLTYERAIRMMDIIRKSYSSEEAKLIFSSQTQDVYAEAIAVAVDLYEWTREVKFKEAAFAFSEKAKMAVLSETVRDLHLKKISGIPTELIREEQKLRQTISKLLIRVSDTRDSLQSMKLRSDLVASEIALSKIQQQLEHNNKYRALKYDGRLARIGVVQDHLESNEALIEYYLAQRDVFIFVVTQEELSVHRQPLSPSFFDAFEKLKTSLYAAREGSAYHGMEASHIVYKFLIDPVKVLVKNKHRWTIVPDGVLHYIPVEALVSDTTEDRFVIEDHAVRYVYSSAFLSSEKHEHSVNDGDVLAFAPFTQTISTAQGLHPLEASGREIGGIPGKHYYDEAATKEVFLTSAASFDIIHLATHAQTSNEDPLNSFIEFFPASSSPAYDSKLYMPEIYNLHLDQTRMVVISACEAGIGKLMKGEGLISLSRAFAAAGCAGIVTSLWKADDESSAALMMSMYRNLQKGYTRDVALRKAKLEYMKANTGQSPVFWANFICIGAADALYEQDKRAYAWVAVLGVGLVLVLAFWAMKYSQQKLKRNALWLGE